MSSRYVSPDTASIEQEFDLARSEWGSPTHFNAAPSQAIPVIRVIEEQPDPVLLTWGFGEYGTFNLPIESLKLRANEPGLLASGKRCIIPALGFYEWHVDANGTRHPFFIHAEDQPLFGFAGLWEHASCTVITLPANAFMAQIDNIQGRMPAILARDLREVWLYGSPVNAAAALAPYPAERLVAYRVSSRVDSPDNNDETLIEPLETDVD